MHKHVKRAETLRNKVVDQHQEVYNFIAETQEDVGKNNLSQGDLVDMGLMCREMETYLEETRKEVKNRKELIGKLLAFHMAQQNLNEDQTKLKVTVKGELASGTPDVKLQVKIPDNGTEEFIQLMEYFGLSRDRLAGVEGCLRLSFNGMRDLVTKLAEEGQGLPPGVTKSWPVYTTTFRRRKKVG